MHAPRIGVLVGDQQEAQRNDGGAPDWLDVPRYLVFAYACPLAQNRYPRLRDTLRASLPGFGGDQLPVGIARRKVAREGPHIGHVRDLVRTAVDDVAVLVARHRDELRDEAHGDLRGAGLDLGAGDVRLVDRNEPRLGFFAARFAVLDGLLEAVGDLLREER